MHGTPATTAEGLGLAVDQNRVAYLVGSFQGNDCPSCGPEAIRYPTTWDAYKHQLTGGDRDAVLSIVDFRPPTPTMLYSTMIPGAAATDATAIALDGSGGAFFGGESAGSGYQPVHGQPPPPMDPGAEDQSFVAHVAAQPATMPDPPADIVLYAADLNGFTPTAIAGDWKIEQDSTAAGGWSVHELDRGGPKEGPPAIHPQDYFEATVLADANVPYQLWLRMKADADSWQNDSVWVQFSDSVDAGGNPVWRIHSNDGTFISLEDCGGCGEHGWGWNDNGYGGPGTPVIFATSGWHTIRFQRREDGIAIDQIVLSSSRWMNTAPGANKNDTTILSPSYAVPSVASAGNAPPTVAITSPADHSDSYTVPATVTITASASDSDGTIARVDFYENGSFIGSSSTSPYSVTWHDVPPGSYRLTAVATDDQGATATSGAISIVVNSGGLPTGWNDVDIGATGATGSAAFAGSYKVQGAGADVWGTADALNFAYVPLAGDGWIVARVATVSDEASWVKAGVMIRSSLSPSSAQAFMLVSHAKGVAFQRRTADGNTSTSSPGSASTAPRWVKLLRRGSTISGYESADGVTWTFVGSDTFAMGSTALVGLAVSSHVSGTLATATFDKLATSLPSGWSDSDVGAVPFAGSASYLGSTFTVTGSGADVWGSSDAFHYAYMKMTGDGTIVARVATLQNVDPWVKAGVMIRETLDPASAHAFMLVSASKGDAFQRRRVAGGVSTSTPGSSATAPRFVRLTRSGNTITAYESDGSQTSDGIIWNQVGSETMPMATTVYIGLAVTSHNTSSSATCTFDNVSIQ